MSKNIERYFYPHYKKREEIPNYSWQPLRHKKIDLEDKIYEYKRGHFVEDVIVYILNKYIHSAIEKEGQSKIEYVRQDIKADRGEEKTDLFIKFKGYPEEIKFQLTTRQDMEELAKKRENLPKDVTFVVLDSFLIADLWKEFLNKKVQMPNITPIEFLETVDERILRRIRDEYIYELIKAIPKDKKTKLAYILQGA